MSSTDFISLTNLNPKGKTQETSISIGNLASYQTQRSHNAMKFDHLNIRSIYRERRLVRRRPPTKSAYQNLVNILKLFTKREIIFLILLCDLLVDFGVCCISALEIESGNLKDETNEFLIIRPAWHYWCNVLFSFYNISSFFTRVSISSNPRSIVFSWSTFVDIVTALPFIFSLFFLNFNGVYWHIPVFLRIWPLIERIRVFLYLQFDANYQSSQYVSFLQSSSSTNPSIISNVIASVFSFLKLDQVTLMLVTLFLQLFGFLYTSMAMFQYLELTFSHRHYGLADSFYFIVITFATVGFGDIAPSNTYSRVSIALSILVAVAYFPRALHRIRETYQLYQRGKRAFVPGVRLRSFVVLVVPAQKNQFADTLAFALQALTTSKDLHVRKNTTKAKANLLNHYSRNSSSDTSSQYRQSSYHLVILAEQPPSDFLKSMLNSRHYSSRITYIEGNPLSNNDLIRCSISKASACFVLSDRKRGCNIQQSTQEDTYSILKVWAINKHAPRVPIYVSSLHPETESHVGSSCKEVVCIRSIRHILLGISCIFKGSSSLIANLIHSPSWTSSFASDTKRNVPKLNKVWLNVHMDSMKNKIFSIPLNPLFIGELFHRLAWYLYAEFQVILIGLRLRVAGIINLARLGIRSSNIGSSDKAYTYRDHIILNPVNFTITLDDGYEVKDLIFISHNVSDLTDIEKLDKSQFDESWEKWFRTEEIIPVDVQELFNERKTQSSSQVDSSFSRPSNFRRRRTTGANDAVKFDLTQKSNPVETQHYIGHPKPPHMMAMDSELQTPSCYLTKLPWKKESARVYEASISTAKDNQEEVKTSSIGITGLEHHIILCSKTYNLWAFMCTVRASFLNESQMKPVLILSDSLPSDEEWKMLSAFPNVYYMIGNCLKKQDLIRAGLFTASCVLILKQDDDLVAYNDDILDTEAIMAAHQIDFMAYDKYVITELISKRNIKFMRAKYEMLNHLPNLTEFPENNARPIDLTRYFEKFSHRPDVLLSLTKKVSQSLTNGSHSRRPSADRSLLENDSKRDESINEDSSSDDDSFWIEEEFSKRTKSSDLYTHSPFFASGRVLAEDMFDSVVFEEFRNPGIVHIVKLLCGRHYKQWTEINTHFQINASVLKQIKVPQRFAGKSFSSLFNHLSLNHCVIPIAIYRDRAIGASAKVPETPKVFEVVSKNISYDLGESQAIFQNIPLGRSSTNVSLNNNHLSNLEEDDNSQDINSSTLMSPFGFLTQKSRGRIELSSDLDKAFSEASKLDNSLPIVITNPIPDFILEKKDLIFVLSTISGDHMK